MLGKVKYYLIGLVSGILISCGISFADEGYLQCNKMVCAIWANNKEVDLQGMPILNYEGRSYLPLAKLGDILGCDIKWDGENRVINVKSSIKEVIKEVPIHPQYEYLKKSFNDGGSIESIYDNQANNFMFWEKMNYSNGETFSGELVNNKRNGLGMYITKNWTYEGEFNNDDMLGLGTYFFSDGTITVQSYNHNEKTGCRYTISPLGIIKIDVENGVDVKKTTYLKY